MGVVYFYPRNRCSIGKADLGDYVVTLRCSCNTVCTITCDSGMPQFILERDVCTVTT